MNSEQLIKGNPEIFKLMPGDIDHLYRRSGLGGNNLSPFRYNAEQAAISTPSEAFKALAESPSLGQVAERLLEPNFKIEFNSGGGSIAEDKYYALLGSEDERVLAQYINSEGEILLLLFPNWKAFLEWWTGSYASQGMAGYKPVFPSIMEIEVLVCAVHCIDIYRRAYMESMLDYRGGVDLSLSTGDYVELLKRALASGDKRWLLPTIFELTPGLKNSKIALKPEHIKEIEDIGFVTSNEGVITLAERSRIMGTEFISSWMGSISLQASTLREGEERMLSRAFLAVTGFANHLFSFEIAPNSDTRFKHQASTLPELQQTLVKWMEALEKAGAKSIAPREQNETKAAKAKFCGQCGSEIRPGKKFCGNCGTPI
jgi:hypothetical protein